MSDQGPLLPNVPSSATPLWAPPAAPGAPAGQLPTSVSTFDLVEASSSRRRPWPVLLGVAAVATLLVVGATWVVLDAARNPSGADSPEEVVDGLVAALDSEDFIALAELLDPAERRSFATPMIEDIVPELARIGVLGDDVDLGSFGGLDLEINDVEYEIVPTAHPDLFHARITGGTTSATVTPDELPLDEVLQDQMRAETTITDITDITGTTGTTEFRSDPNGPVLAIVERDDRWYLSLWHTLGESVRMANGVDLPDLADLPVAVGADSPEAAMSLMLEHVVDLDLVGFVGMVDPEEADALYRYVGLAFDDYDQLRNDIMSKLDDEQISWELSELEFDVDRDGDTAAVALTAGRVDVAFPQGAVAASFDTDEVLLEIKYDDGATRLDLDARLQPPNYSVTVSYADEFDSVSSELEMVADAADNRITVTGNIDGDPIEAGFVLDPDGECSEGYVRFADLDESVCYEDEIAESGLPVGVDTDLEELIDQLATPASLRLPPGTAHRVDGRWYFAPVSTAMDWMTQWLQALDDDAYSDIVSAVSDLESPFDNDIGFDLGDDGLLDDQGASEVPPVFVDVEAGEQAEVEVQFEGQGWTVVNLRAPPGTAMTAAVLETIGIDPTVEVDDGNVLTTANDDFDDQTLSSGVSFTMPDDGAVEIRVANYFGNSGSTQMLISAGTADTDPIDLDVLLGR